MLAAAFLALTPLQFILVGSAALWLHGERLRVHDLDIVPAPTDENYRCLRSSLAEIGVRGRCLPSRHAWTSLDVVTMTSAYGDVDLMLHRGRRSFGDLQRRGTVVNVLDVDVSVASLLDTQVLRRRFKGSS